MFVLASGLFSSESPVPARVPVISDTKMIALAEDIAVVNITKLEMSDYRGYSQKATALVEKIVKGSLQPKLCFHGGKGSKGGPTPHLELGRSLVFLSKDGDRLCCLESLYASVPIRDGKLPWCGIDTSEKAVLTDIARRVAAGSGARHLR